MKWINMFVKRNPIRTDKLKNKKEKTKNVELYHSASVVWLSVLLSSVCAVHAEPSSASMRTLIVGGIKNFNGPHCKWRNRVYAPAPAATKSNKRIEQRNKHDKGKYDKRCASTRARTRSLSIACVRSTFRRCTRCLVTSLNVVCVCVRICGIIVSLVAKYGRVCASTTNESAGVHEKVERKLVLRSN